MSESLLNEDFFENRSAVVDFYSTKRKRREQRKQNKNLGINLRDVTPKTLAQQETFDSYHSGQNSLLHGYAGTGKTFVSCYLAMKDVLSQYTDYEKLIIVRSVVPTRDMGFLPGNQKEKAVAYELPYSVIFSELFDRNDAYQLMKSKGKVDFISTSFIRGTTLNNSIVLVDECQNMTYHELDSVITRMGTNSRIIFSGDYRQTDLQRDSEKNGVQQFMSVLEKMRSFDSIEFLEDDIVRSGLVKDYIIQKERLHF